jgi:hypothetical protein
MTLDNTMRATREALVALGAELNGPAPSAVIDRVTSLHGVDLADDVRSLYAEANGSDGEFGECSWHFWGIDDEEVIIGSYLKLPRQFVISATARAIDPMKYVRFFDALVDAPLYAYCADRRSAHFGEVIGCNTDSGAFDAFVSAKSVSAFLRKLIATGGGEAILIDE